MTTYTMKWDIGSHISFEKKINATLHQAIEYGMHSLQFFLGNPKGFKRAVISDSDIKESIETLGKFPMNVFTHYPYVVNLCGSKDTLSWKKDEKQTAKTKLQLQGLQYELDTLSKLKIDDSKTTGVVIHPGNHVKRKKGLRAIAKSINTLNFQKSMLLLENSAGAGTSLATTLKEIKYIIDHVKDSKKDHIGVCIDTCHLYAYGEYDFSLISEIERFFTEFGDMIGVDKLKLIHLNDNNEKAMKGSKKDRHEIPGLGLMWKEDCSALVYLLDKCEQLKIPCVLESQCIAMIALNDLYNKTH